MGVFEMNAEETHMFVQGLPRARANSPGMHAQTLPGTVGAVSKLPFGFARAVD